MSKNRAKLYIRFLIYFTAVLIVAVFPPIVDLWNQIEPHIFGLPLAQISVITIAVLMIFGLMLWFFLEGRLNEAEKKLRQRGNSVEH